MGKASKKEQQAYQRLTKKHQPKSPVWRNVVRAFVVGGLIGVIAQGLINFFMMYGMTSKQAAEPMLGIVIFGGALLTGLGWYDRLGRFAGMGASLPISGFANSIVSPAMEFKREGFILGVGAKMFAVAGPVIVYGLLASFVAAGIKLLLGGSPT